VENYKAYVEADATQHVRQIKSGSFFLIHGLADKSVPYQHGVQLASALTEAGVLFRYQVIENIEKRKIFDSNSAKCNRNIVFVFILLMDH
jgi:hypothetical protein